MRPRYGEKISYSEALALTRKNTEDKWRGRGADNRLEPEAWPTVTPKFRLASGQRIFTMGSCFARNIEEYLHQLQFEIPTLRMTAAGESSGGRPNAILNKYTPVSIVQELEWTRRILDRDGMVTWEDVAPMMVETSSGLYLDMHLSTSEPVSRDRVLERRKELFLINKDGFAASVVVITPGVIEAWYDEATGLFVQRMPPPIMVKRRGEGRFKFKVLTYEECYASLSRAVDLIDPAGKKWFLFTVSPVPLSRTFTDQDIIIANQYAKSLLRAVVGRICMERENCDYFPSYESVMLTKQKDVWENDLIHVSEGFVSKIVRHLVSGRLEEGPLKNRLSAVDMLSQFGDHIRKKQFAPAYSIYREMGEQARAIELPAFHKQAAVLLMVRKEFRIALVHAQRLVDLRPGTWMPLLRVARIQLLCGQPGPALAAAQDALALTQLKPHRDTVSGFIKRLSTSAA